MFFLLTLVAIAGFAGSLLYASYTDLKSMRITNETCLFGLAMFALYAISFSTAHGIGWLMPHLLTGIGVFTICAVLNALNLLGGGDVKLMGVLGFWARPVEALDLFFLVTILGGIFALAFYIAGMAKSAAPETAEGPKSALEARPIPYGPAITIAGLYHCSELILNALS